MDDEREPAAPEPQPPGFPPAPAVAEPAVVGGEPGPGPGVMADGPEPPVGGAGPVTAPEAVGGGTEPPAAASRRQVAAAKAQAAAGQVGAGVDRGLTRAQPVLGVAAKGLGGLGRLVMTASVVGAVGAALLVVLGLRAFGTPGLLFGLTGLAPLAGWRVGRRAVRGAGLLGDPHRVLAAVKASGQAGRQWLDHMSELGGAAKARRGRRVARSAIGAGRSLWRAVGPDVEGADDLRALALWPRTVAMTAAGLLSTLLLPIALLWALLALLF